MRTALFDYDLPAELVASAPTEARDGARLLALGEPPEPAHAIVGIRDLIDLVPTGALVVVNDTRVLNARLLGHKVGSGGKVEIFLVRRAGPQAPGVWLALGRASKSLRAGTQLTLGRAAGLRGEILGNDPDEGLLRVALACARKGEGDGDGDGDGDLDAAIRREGAIPLPPYIRRPATEVDEERYQTVFAREEGAVAAPTAGLHLTRAMLSSLAAKGVDVASVTLHVGLGTFSPVVADDLDDHAMHSETYSVPAATADAIAAARLRGAPVVAIGTTVVRALESAADPTRPGHVAVVSAQTTRLLIQPGYPFAIVDALLTNFHLPKSTLLALVCAFGGHERVLAAYEHAVRSRLRFFSYGDAMFLARRPHCPPETP
ncbi:MAG: tRNA preQ1(34) S-adenosylmethionine ribosyltransferase-isomerase QueA [Myxococcales bacterium]|nr:tRNA preQ1(34) S-adenosylmethionine ribosyltransferase-isomerase QueA [Myxococcales bacterium]